MTALASAEYLASRNSEVKAVSVDAWGEGVQVFVKAMNCLELDEVSVMAESGIGDGAQAARFVQVVACDDQGQRLYAEADLPLLESQPFNGLKQIVDAALEFNGLTQSAIGAIRGN